MNKKRLFIFILAFLLSFISTRVYLHLSPNSNLIIGGYNIHHLFVGLLLLTFSSIPLILYNQNNIWLNLATLFFAIGLSLSLDEWVYLIATDGSDSSYLLPISLWGAITLIVIVIVYLFGFLLASKTKK